MVADASPTFQVNVIGMEPIREIDIIKNNRIIFARRAQPGTSDPRRVEFSFRDSPEFGGDFADTSMASTAEITNWNNPETGIRARRVAGTSYYYVRVIQSYSPAQPDVEGEIAWSSPISSAGSKDSAGPRWP